jgi:hypothetical protein
VLVWTKALLMFRNELVAVDGLAGEVRPAEPGFTGRDPTCRLSNPAPGE